MISWSTVVLVVRQRQQQEYAQMAPTWAMGLMLSQGIVVLVASQGRQWQAIHMAPIRAMGMILGTQYGKKKNGYGPGCATTLETSHPGIDNGALMVAGSSSSSGNVTSICTV